MKLFVTLMKLVCTGFVIYHVFDHNTLEGIWWIGARCGLQLDELLDATTSV